MRRNRILSILLVMTLIFMYPTPTNTYAFEIESNLSQVHEHEDTLLLSESIYVDEESVTREIFSPVCPICGAMAVSYKEYIKYSYNPSQHVQNSYRDYEFSCIKHGTLTQRFTDNPWQNHSISYRNMGCYSNIHTFRPNCYCGFTSTDIQAPCTGNPHVTPERLGLFSVLKLK